MVKNTTIKELIFDDKNPNKHTEQGLKLLEKSLQKLGAGRSILIDKDNRIIAGNGVIEVAAQIGLEKLKIIETDGTEIIAVKRKDLSLDSPQGREMAIADNQTAKVGINFDLEILKEISQEFNIKADDWDLPLIDYELPEDLENYAPEHFLKEKQKLTLSFQLKKEDYEFVLAVLNEIDENTNNAIIALCKLYKEEYGSKAD